MKLSLLGALVAPCLLIGVAQADLKWTETMKLSGGPSGAPAGMGISIMSVHYMNKEASRTDTKTQLGPMAMVMREIDLCPTKKTLSFFDQERLYSEESLRYGSLMPGMPMGGAGMPGMPARPSGPKQSGTRTISYNLRDLGAATIAGTPTRHYAMDMTMTATGCAGKGTNKMTMEVWKANIAMPAPCLTGTFADSIKKAVPVMGRSNCQVKTVLKGNTSAAAKAFGGFIMRMKVNIGNTVVTRDVTQLSRSPLPASTFAVPAGYRKVSAAELAKARQQRMMSGMMGNMNEMMKGMGKR